MIQNINDVVAKLDEIIDWAKQNQSPIGYFAALYRRMTLAVQVGIIQNRFKNGARMEKLDVLFAKRYFEAFDHFQKGLPVTSSWKTAFEATKNNQITVIQHLMLGINAHINLDLGITAALTSPKNEIHQLEKDFNQINNIIASLVDDSKQKLSKIWLPFRITSDLLATESDGIINFSIKVARIFSWESAKKLAQLEGENSSNQIIKIDQNVTILASKVLNAGWFMRSVLWVIRMGESGTVSDKIKILS
jgi:Family of unknown function (DUF5995)